jgi:DNA-binding MarR family transcriptional regulator
MAGRLQQEIRQAKPFVNREEEVFLLIQRTAEVLTRRLAEALKPSELTPTQYNVLRILRGAEPEGLPCREISDRMVTYDPDITRLLDRLETRELVGRARGEKDRRVVFTRITPDGLGLLAELDAALERFLAAELGHLGRERLQTLATLLEQACRPQV